MPQELRELCRPLRRARIKGLRRSFRHAICTSAGGTCDTLTRPQVPRVRLQPLRTSRAQSVNGGARLRKSAATLLSGRIKTMKTKAAICYAAGKPLEIVTVDLDGPKAGEVLIELKATGVCHTDEFTRSGADQ